MTATTFYGGCLCVAQPLNPCYVCLFASGVKCLATYFLRLSRASDNASLCEGSPGRLLAPNQFSLYLTLIIITLILARFNQRKKGPYKITKILICQMVDGSVCDDGLKQGYSNDKSQNKTDKTAITEFLIFIETIAICFFFLK